MRRHCGYKRDQIYFRANVSPSAFVYDETDIIRFLIVEALLRLNKSLLARKWLEVAPTKRPLRSDSVEPPTRLPFVVCTE